MNFASLVDIVLLVRIFAVLMLAVGVLTSPGKFIRLPPTVSCVRSGLNFWGRQFKHMFL